MSAADGDSIDDILSVVESYGPFGLDVNNAIGYQIKLAEEVKRLRVSLNEMTAARDYEKRAHAKATAYWTARFSAAPTVPAQEPVCRVCNQPEFPFCARGDCPLPDGRTTSEALLGKSSARMEVVPITLDTPERVCFYEQEFYVLSNFSSFRLEWRGRQFDTSEHAYHWERFNGCDQELQDAVMNCPSAHEAFRLAQDQKQFQRENWNAIKVGVMRDILREKARQHEYVRRKLVQTGGRLLVENSWRDDFWGWGPNRDGQNMLGKLWMEIRSELTRHDKNSGREP